MTKESKTRSIQQLADDLKRVRSQAVEQTLQHASTRAGLKIVDKIVEPVCDGASEDEHLARGRFQNLGWWPRDLWFRVCTFFSRRRMAREEMDREFRLLNYRLKTLLDQATEMKKTIALGAKVIAQQEQRAQVRLQQLEANHGVLRDTLNAQAEAIENLQKKQG